MEAHYVEIASHNWFGSNYLLLTKAANLKAILFLKYQLSKFFSSWNYYCKKFQSPAFVNLQIFN